ncbi:MAG: hypothetical protein K4571_17955 [Deltaproteobacteria bacterium]
MEQGDQGLPLFRDGRDYFVKLPFLVKGEIEYPPDINADSIRGAFDEKVKQTGKQPSAVTHVQVAGAQVIREPLLNRSSVRGEEAYFYQIMPGVDPVRVGYFEPVQLARELYNVPFDDILAYLGRLSAALGIDRPLARRAMELFSLASNVPSGFFEMAFASFGAVLNPQTAARTVDIGLAFFGHAGREFIDHWVELPLHAAPGAAIVSAAKIFGEAAARSAGPSIRVRALPTRQLHITAGNAPGIPFISALRCLATKSAGLIKMPYGVTIPGALLALAMKEAGSDHPLTRFTSIVYWPGGDESIENVFYRQDFFDRIVVWGSPESVASVKSKALFTRVLTFNPRYSMSFIGREAFPEHIEEAAIKGSTDSMIWNQKACIASLVHYVEGTEEDVIKYCESVAAAMKKWDAAMPNLTPPEIEGQIRRLRRGKLASAKWFYNAADGHFQSAVVYVPGEFDMEDHPMWRLIVVRRVDSLEDCLKYLSSSVTTVGIYPEARRIELLDRVAACGVSNVVELGKSDRLVTGAPHDGMMVYSELVDWKNA